MTTRHHAKVSILLLLFFSFQIFAREKDQAVKLAFKLQPDEVLTVDKYQDIRIFNGFTWQTREEKNRIILKVNQLVEEGSRLSGKFLTYSRSPRRTGSFHLNKSWVSSFIIQKNGKYIVPEKFTMPNLRSLPSFPDHAITNGDTWKADANEVLNMAGMRILIPVNVQYEYKGVEKISVPGIRPGDYDRIEYKYNFSIPVRNQNPTIKRISGFTVCALWFDREQGIPVYDSSRLVYDFHLAGGQHQQFMFKIQSWYNKKIQTLDIQKDRIVNNIKKDLDTNKKNQTLSVRKNKDGIVLELSDILFQHNKYNLTDDARSSIERVATILKKYPDNEIRILGHTDSSGNPVYNQRLSSKRANNVLKALIQKHGINGNRLSYKGMGERMPVESNSTPQGRARNRRVEILIVTD